MLKLQDIKNIINNGGATLKNGKIRNLKSGYMYSIYLNEIRIKKEDINTIKIILNLFSRRFKRCYVGVWVNGGDVFIDVSVRTNTKKDALQRGRNNKQQAIYNNRNHKTIFIN